MAKKKPIPIQLGGVEREKLEALASAWGLSLAATVRVLIRNARIPKI